MYIRTKDGVYEVLSEYEQSENTTLISNPVRAFDVKVTPRTFNGSSIRIIYGSEIIKQSETLEELCDGFYIDVDLNVERNFEYAFHHFEHFAKTMKSFRTTSKVMVKRLGGGYGYIRTDKCLLYVAKINDKGELELL